MTNPSSDVLILGGGLIGLSLAYELAQQNVSVTVLEKGDMGQEASSAGAGMLAPQAEMDTTNPLTELCLASRALYARFVQEVVDRTGLSVEYSQCGLLFLALSSAEEKEIRRRYQWQQGLGLQVQQLSRQDAVERVGNLGPEVSSALFFPEEAYVDNVQLIRALCAACRQLDVRFVTGCAAHEIVVEKDRAIGVFTDTGAWHAGQIVIAAGSWSHQIKTFLPYSIPMEPVRGQLLSVQTLEPLKHMLYSEIGYLLPRQDERIILGSTTEWVGYDKNVTLEGLHKIISAAIRLLPAVRSCSYLQSWAGLRPHCKDGNPLIGGCDVEGLYFATGHYRNGLLLAPITAKLMAELLLSSKIPEPLKPFTPNRFRNRT